MSAHNYSPPWRRGVGYALLILFGLVFIGPFLIQLATSFKTDADAANKSLSLIPHPVTLSAWQRIFGFTENAGIPFGRWLTNSIVVATFITLGRVFLDSLAGYALARLRFPGRQAVLEYPGVKGSTVLRVILAGSRMFWVVARGDNVAADAPKVRGFLDSLKIN